VKRRSLRRTKGWTAVRVVTGEYGAAPKPGPGWCESIIQRLSRRQKRCGSRGTGATKRARGQRARGSRPPDPTKGPYRWKTSRIEGSVALYGAAWRAVSAALSPKGPTRAPKRSRADFSKEDARAKARETEGKRERRQGCQRLGPIGHRGKKTPTLVIKVGDGLGARRSRSGKRVRYDPPKRSERRETFVPPVILRGALRLRAVSTRRKSR
jgi:hypothetical protein